MAGIDLSNIAAGAVGFVINGQGASDYSGFSVSSAGDVNGDGLADLIVGADFSVPASLSQARCSYVVFGMEWDHDGSGRCILHSSETEAPALPTP